jgi:large subunit ribosomal protein L10
MQTRKEKEALVAEVRDQVKAAKALVFTDYKGVSVKDLSAIRAELRKSGSGFQVLKKTLLDIALREAGIGVSTKALQGQIGVAYSHDEVAAAKVFADFLKANKETTLSIQGGALGEKALDAAEVKALAKLPSQDELRAKLLGTLSAPAQGFVRVLSGNLSGLVQVLRAVGEAKA